MNSFIALKILAQLLATPLGVFVCGLVAAAVLILFRMPRLGRLVGALAIAQLIAFSLYPVAAP